MCFNKPDLGTYITLDFETYKQLKKIVGNNKLIFHHTLKTWYYLMLGTQCELVQCELVQWAFQMDLAQKETLGELGGCLLALGCFSGKPYTPAKH